jgi:uncharacterized membrane protein
MSAEATKAKAGFGGEGSLGRAAFLALAWSALLMGAMNARFVTTDTTVFDPLFREKYGRYIYFVVTHGACSIVALVIGPWGFSTWLRKKSPRTHRNLGKLYLGCVMVGGITGLRMAMEAHGGLSGKAGLTSLGLLWLWTGWNGYASARGKRFAEHRRWMVRSYCLTYAAVTLRLYLTYGTTTFGLDYDALYRVVAWGAWVPQLAVAELWFWLEDRAALERKAERKAA